MHGRNKDNWLKKGLETSLRYAYLYSDEELKQFIPHVKTSARLAKGRYVMFNNCYGGFAMRNAERMKTLIKEAEEKSSAWIAYVFEFCFFLLDKTIIPTPRVANYAGDTGESYSWIGFSL